MIIDFDVRSETPDRDPDRLLPADPPPAASDPIAAWTTASVKIGAVCVDVRLRTRSTKFFEDAKARQLQPATIAKQGSLLQNVTLQQLCCWRNTYVVSSPRMTSQELKRWLAKQGCTFEPGKSGHLIVRLGDRMSILPMHGGGKDLGTGIVNAIKRQLGLS